MNISWVSTGWLFLHNYLRHPGIWTFQTTCYKEETKLREVLAQWVAKPGFELRISASGADSVETAVMMAPQGPYLAEFLFHEGLLVVGGLVTWCRSHRQHPAGKCCWIIFLSKLAVKDWRVTASNYSSPPFACILWSHSEAQKRHICIGMECWWITMKGSDTWHGMKVVQVISRHFSHEATSACFISWAWTEGLLLGWEGTWGDPGSARHKCLHAHVSPSPNRTLPSAALCWLLGTCNCFGAGSLPFPLAFASLGKLRQVFLPAGQCL